MEVPSFFTEQTLSAKADWRVLMSSPERFLNPWALWLKEDIGDLGWERGQVWIGGRKAHELCDVAGVTLVRQKTPWLALLLWSAIFIATTLGGGFLTFTPSNPLTPIAFLAFTGLILLSTWAAKWIRISGRTPDGVARVIYIIPIESSHRRRSVADTRRLHETLVKEVLG
jgi:hypothetical protein